MLRQNFARVCSTFEDIVAEEAEPLEHKGACAGVKHEPALVDYHLTEFVRDCY